MLKRVEKTIEELLSGLEYNEYDEVEFENNFKKEEYITIDDAAFINTIDGVISIPLGYTCDPDTFEGYKIGHFEDAYLITEDFNDPTYRDEHKERVISKTKTLLDLLIDK